MREELCALAARAFGANALDAQDLGGGFYGRAWRVRIDRAPGDIVLKAYRFPGMAEKEAIWLRTLRRHALARMPEVYGVYPAENTPDGASRGDVLAMEYLPGINAGRSNFPISDGDRRKIAGEIIDNLLAWHTIEHPEGFGELSGDSFVSDFREVYRPEAQATARKARALYEAGGMDAAVLDTVERALSGFDRVFCLPIRSARLIHGDYNTWNVLLDERMTCVAAVIDPFHSRWADPEFDLYQLSNANGRWWGLFERYAAQMRLSDNFEAKNAFYQLFTEIAHYHDAGVDPSASALPSQARALEEHLREIGA